MECYKRGWEEDKREGVKRAVGKERGKKAQGRVC